MPVILPFCVFGLIAWNLVLLLGRRGDGVSKREVFLLSAVVWGTLLVAITELLGAFRSLRIIPLSSTWGACAAALAASDIFLSRKRVALEAGKSSTPPRALRLVMAGVVTILSGTLLTAIVAPPNTFDSMTYHMARVAHWAQNGSLAHYATNITRQLYAAPGAELFILNLQILSGGDRFANLVQWLALAGCVAAASLLSKIFGADGTGQTMTGFVMATLPAAVLQASSTQNDLFVAFWVLSFVFFLVSWKQRPELWRAAAAGASLGLAALTKVTALLTALPFLLVFGLGALAMHRGRRLAGSLAIGVALFVGLNLGHGSRNVALFGDPLGVRADETNVRVRAMSLPLFLSNAVKSAAMHLGTPFSSLNRRLEEAVVSVPRSFGLDPDDPRTSFIDKKFAVTRFSVHEDTVGNPLHLGLALLTTALCLAGRDLRRRPELLAYLVAAVASALVFPLALSWQPWIARLHLPVFAVWSVPAAIALQSAVVPRALVRAVLAALAIGALPALLRNSSRPLTGPRTILRSERVSDYFRNAPERENPYRDAARLLAERACREVGLAVGPDDWEYPLNALVENGTRIEHVGVENVSARAASPSFVPCAVFSTVERIPSGFAPGWSSGGVKLLVPR